MKKIIKVYNKTTKYGFCIKKDYINDKLVEIQGICLDFEKNQIIDIDKHQCEMIEKLYCKNDSKLYQLSIKRFKNKNYGKIIYKDIKNSFLILEKDEVLEK